MFGCVDSETVTQQATQFLTVPLCEQLAVMRVQFIEEQVDGSDVGKRGDDFHLIISEFGGRTLGRLSERMLSCLSRCRMGISSS